MVRSGWWVFDRPFRRDPLFVSGVLVGLAGAASSLLAGDQYSPGGRVLAPLTSVPSALVAVGITAGSVREYLRARRGSPPQPFSASAEAGLPGQ